MNLIKISDNVYINPDKVTSVEVKNIKGFKRLIVNLDDRNFVVEIPDKTFMTSLIESGVNFGDQFFSV